MKHTDTRGNKPKQNNKFEVRYIIIYLSLQLILTSTLNTADWDVPKLPTVGQPKPSTLDHPSTDMKAFTQSAEDTVSMESNTKVPPTPPSTPLLTPSNVFGRGIDNAIEAVLKGTSDGIGSGQSQQPVQGKESEEAAVVDGAMDSNNAAEPAHGTEVKIQV